MYAWLVQPLEMQTISQLGLPIARPDEDFLRGLRAGKYLKESKFTVRDYHGRKFGATAYADVAPDQPMTLLNMDSSLSAISIIEGTVTGSEDGIHCREIVHMNVNGNVEDVPKVIVGSQHVSMTLGHWMDSLVEAAGLLGLEVRHL